MTDDNSIELVDIPEDLKDFKAVFLNKNEPEAKDEIGDDAPATDEDTDAAEGDDTEADDEAPTEESDDSEDKDDEKESEDEDEPDKEKPKKPSAQTRINEINRKWRQEQRERAQERAEFTARIEALEKSRPESSKQEPVRENLPQGAPTPNALDDKGEPKYPLGEFDPNFIFDLTEFSIEHKTKEMEARRAQEAEATRLTEAQNTLKSEWADKLEAYEEEVPEVREHIEELVDTFQNVAPAYGEYLATTLMSCENGPAIMEYLSQNIGEAQKIVASGPAAATLAIGRLEAKFSKPARLNEEPRNKTISGSAPPPSQVVRGSAKGRTSVRPDTKDLAAFKREFLK